MLVFSELSVDCMLLPLPRVAVRCGTLAANRDSRRCTWRTSSDRTRSPPNFRSISVLHCIVHVLYSIYCTRIPFPFPFSFVLFPFVNCFCFFVTYVSKSVVHSVQYLQSIDTMYTVYILFVTLHNLFAPLHFTSCGCSGGYASM